MPHSFERNDYPIVLFDSQCLLCNTFVQWIIKKDEYRLLKFSGLQSHKSQYEISRRNIPMPDNDSVVLLYKDRFFTGSEAALEILKMIEKSSFPVRLATLIPESWRQKMYRWVSRNRYRFYKKRNYCPMPDPSEADRFV